MSRRIGRSGSDHNLPRVDQPIGTQRARHLLGNLSGPGVVNLYTPDMSNRNRLVRVLPWGLLAGLLLTLAFLGQGQQFLPGCRQSAGPRVSRPPLECVTLKDGFPVSYLSSYTVVERATGKTSNIPTVTNLGAPVIDKGGLIMDWLLWSLASCAVLYFLVPTVSNARARLRSQPTI